MTEESPLTPETSAAPHDEYHKARKNLVLVAGFLLAWTLIGIEPEMRGASTAVEEQAVSEPTEQPEETPTEAEPIPADAGETPDASVPQESAAPQEGEQPGDSPQRFCGEVLGFGVCIRNPAVAPFVLMLLVLYFGLRFAIEASMARGRRDRDLVLRVDVGLAWVIAGSAIAAFLAWAMAGVDVGAWFVGDDLFNSPLWAIQTSLLVIALEIVRSRPALLTPRSTDIIRGPDRVALAIFLFIPAGLLTLLVWTEFGIPHGVVAGPARWLARLGMVAIVVSTVRCVRAIRAAYPKPRG